MIRDPSEIHNSNIWESASKAKSKQFNANMIQKTFIITGSPSSGKSSFVKVLKSDLDFETKPTNLLEYISIKRSGVKKQLLHCYQIANESLTEIISSLIPKEGFADTVFIVCVDLSNPNKVIENTLNHLEILRKETDKFVQQKLIGREQKWTDFTTRIDSQISSHEDRGSINPMPLNTIIIGNKYDLFEKYDTESRKWLARTLRYIAHHNNSSLFFCSIKNMQVGAQLRAHLRSKIVDGLEKQSAEASRTGNTLASESDHTKPIFIKNGDDTVSSMKLPTSGSLGAVQILKKQLSSLFGEQQQKKKETLDFSKYRETQIDQIIEQKKKELERITKMLQNSESRTNKRI